MAEEAPGNDLPLGQAGDLFALPDAFAAPRGFVCARYLVSGSAFHVGHKGTFDGVPFGDLLFESRVVRFVESIVVAHAFTRILGSMTA